MGRYKRGMKNTLLICALACVSVAAGAYGYHAAGSLDGSVVETAPATEADPFGDEPFSTWVPDPDNGCLLVPPSVAEEHRRRKDSETVVAACASPKTAG